MILISSEHSVLASFSRPPPSRKGGGGEKDAKISQCWQKGGFILFEFLEGDGVKMGEWIFSAGAPPWRGAEDFLKVIFD